jgi:23S rRNA (guanosine2251-2'-O)-methyltransferase
MAIRDKGRKHGRDSRKAARPPEHQQSARTGSTRTGSTQPGSSEPRVPAGQRQPPRKPTFGQKLRDTGRGARPSERAAQRGIPSSGTAPPRENGRTGRQPEPPRRPIMVPAPAAITGPFRTPAGKDARPPREGGLWLYGRHAVAAALANPQRRIRRFLALPELAEDARTLITASGARLPPGPQPEILMRAAFEALVPAGAVHQGMALAAEPLPELAVEDVIDRVGPPPEPGAVAQIIVVLDQVTDPHNIGAVLRSAAAFGAVALVLPEHGAPPVTGTLAKAASGALEHVPILRVVNLVRAIDRLKSAGFWCVGLDEAAGRTLAELKLEGRIALVLGAEGEGMRRLTRERCDLVARLPTTGAIASLNVSNAAAIALYELIRGTTIRA